MAECDVVRQGLVGHVFRTARRAYFYDTYSNEVMSTGDTLREVLAALLLRTREARTQALRNLAAADAGVEGCLAKVQALREEGRLFGRIEPPDAAVDTDPSQAAGSPNALILEVTEACNLRCSYCTFSGLYEDGRTHTSQHMDTDLALQAIDRFLAEADPQRDLSISFFGGEPLLRVPFLLTCMTRARAQNPGVSFHLTTNGILLSREVLEQLVPFEPRIVVSLDGPAAVQDRHRRTADGKGTFHRVMDHLWQAWADFPAYVQKGHLAVHAVIADVEAVEETAAFFNGANLPPHVGVFTSRQSQQGLREGQEPRLVQLPEEAAAARNRYIQALLEGRPMELPFEHDLYHPALRRILQRKRKPLKAHPRMRRPCRVGSGHLFVSARGELRLCEKTDRLPALGRVEGWLEPAKLEAMDRVNDALNEACWTCWTLRLCTVCFADNYRGSGPEATPDGRVRLRACHELKTSVEAALRLHQELLEADPQVFQRLATHFGVEPSRSPAEGA